MPVLPKKLQHIALFLERLPGIGQKSANRMAFQFLKLPEADLIEFAHNLSTLKSTVGRCRECQNLTEGSELCEICGDPERDTSTITIVEQVLDILSFESGNIYKGLYHVLYGKIDPLNRVGPEDLTIDQLLARLSRNKDRVKEIIIATNPDTEGEATASYITKQLRQTFGDTLPFTVSRLAYGLPIGANLEFTDYMTLKKSLEGRVKF